MANGEINCDLQREMEYTTILAQRIVDRYHKENIVLSSHVVAYVAFKLLQRAYPQLDLFGLLRLPPEEVVFPLDAVLGTIEQFQQVLKDFERRGRLKLSRQIHWSAMDLLRNGLRNLGTYHVDKPLIFKDDKSLASQDLKLLFFYHNRLDNYPFPEYMDFKRLTGKQMENVA